MSHKLTSRENQILRLIAKGKSNKEIGNALGIKESTVENHTHNIYNKIGVSTRIQATLYAFQVLQIEIENNKSEKNL